MGTEHDSEKSHLRKSFKRDKQWFSVLSAVLEHFSIKKSVRALDCISCSGIFQILRPGNNPVVLKNSTELAAALFVVLLKLRSLQLLRLILPKTTFI